MPFSAWLAMQEERHGIVLYEADMDASDWTQHCLRQADCILIVGLGAAEPALSPMEEQVSMAAMGEPMACACVVPTIRNRDRER